MVGRHSYWEELERPGPDSVTVEGAELRRGSRVRLWPRSGGDVFDLALKGRAAVIEGIEQEMDGALQLAVTVDDDPGRDLGDARQPSHRFFFSLEEVEPIDGPRPSVEQSARILVAGIGNVFLGDDGFGVAVAGRLQDVQLPPGVDVADFGIRGMDLAYALEDYEVAILVDATPRGDAPGTLYVIEPELDPDEVAIDTHGMDPVKVLLLARELGKLPERVLVVGCEPRTRLSGEDGDMLVELSEPVRAAVHEAVRVVESLLGELTTADGEEGAK